MSSQPIIETLNSARQTVGFEWAFAISIANLTVQLYRLVAQFVTLIFDIFKLKYGVELFWPLTTDDLRPYTHYFANQGEILYKLLESLVLTVFAFYAVHSLLNYSTVGLVICLVVFMSHSLLLIVGVLFVTDENWKILSIEFVVWFLILAIEIGTLITVLIYTIYFSMLNGTK